MRLFLDSISCYASLEMSGMALICTLPSPGKEASDCIPGRLVAEVTGFICGEGDRYNCYDTPASMITSYPGPF